MVASQTDHGEAGVRHDPFAPSGGGLAVQDRSGSVAIRGLVGGEDDPGGPAGDGPAITVDHALELAQEKPLQDSPMGRIKSSISLFSIGLKENAAAKLHG